MPRDRTWMPGPRDEDMERRMGPPGMFDLESMAPPSGPGPVTQEQMTAMGGPGPLTPGRRMFMGGPGLQGPLGDTEGAMVMPDVQVARKPKMTVDRLQQANAILEKYKRGKAQLDARVVENEKWYRQRHWEMIQGNDGNQEPRYKTRTAWLFNALNILHSDAMDAYPRLNVLPREQEDEEEARRLSSIIPVVMKQNDFKTVYSENTWRKGRSGNGVYGIFWDSEKLNGLGDISIQAVDILNLFWEPGKDDIQKSANVFHVEMIEREALRKKYPQLENQALKAETFRPRTYDSEDDVRGEDKVAVVDWYYKVTGGGKTVLHYCKYVGTTVLYASEDDYGEVPGKPPRAEAGWYDHGQYPFVMDPFYPVEGSPAGFGLLDVNKNTQEDVDLMQSAIVTNTNMRAYPRYAIRSDGGVNEEDFIDWTKPLIKYEGNSLSNDLEPIVIPDMPGTCVTVLNNTVEMLKQTSGSTDFATGRSTGGVTAYSAIAALIETAGKNTKSFSEGSYRSTEKVGLLVLELIRQFYDYDRQFRIEGEAGRMEFIQYNNAKLQKRALGMSLNGEEMYRLPLFDLDISAEKESTYTRLARNELAKELMGMGVFNPQNVDQSLMMLEMMDFDGKEKLIGKLQEMGTLAQRLAYFQQIALAMAQKYDPFMAEQIAQTIMQQAQGGFAPQAGAQDAGAQIRQDAITGVQQKEHANGPKARGLVNDATKPR